MGLAPTAYVLRVVARVRSSELEMALLLLPFTDALRLMGYLVDWLRQGSQVGGWCACMWVLAVWLIEHAGGWSQRLGQGCWAGRGWFM